MAKNDDTTAAKDTAKAPAVSSNAVKGAAPAASDTTQPETAATAPAASTDAANSAPAPAPAPAPTPAPAPAPAPSFGQFGPLQQASKQVPVAFEVIARIDGFWRADRQWTTAPQVVPLRELTAEQIEQLEREPLLITRAVYGEY